jgi:uncharacterized protein YjbI with pentapeptide repeats
MENIAIREKIEKRENYETRFANARRLTDAQVHHRNPRQIYAVVVLQLEDRLFFRFHSKQAPHLPDDYSSIIVEIGATSTNFQDYLTFAVTALEREQEEYLAAGCMDRKDTFLARLLSSDKARLIEARGLEIHDQDWSYAVQGQRFPLVESYFYGCTFQNITAREVDLTFSQFKRCEFGYGVNFERAELFGTRFFDRCVFDESLNVAEADCRYVDFSDTEIRGNFKRANLSGIRATSFSSYPIRYKFLGGYLKDPSLEEVRRQFQKADLQKARLDTPTHRVLRDAKGNISMRLLVDALDGVFAGIAEILNKR